MKRILVLLLAMCTYHICFSQIDFDGQPINEYKAQNSFRNRFLHQTDSAFRLERNVDFELRLWFTKDNSQEVGLFILSVHSGKSKARCFRYSVSPITQLEEIAFSNKGTDSLLKNMIKNGILTLPTQDSLNDRMIKYSKNYKDHENQPLQDKGFADCSYYNFEIFTPSKFRVYDYHCPAYYQQSYTHIEELYRVCAILTLIEESIGISIL